MTTVIAEERYADVIDEIKGLFELHWEEIALNKEDIPLDPDYSVYEALDRAGAMVICTVRNNGRLIGYAVYFVRKHPHYRNHTWAVSDLFWVNPSYRDGRIGDNLFAFIEKTLTDKGVHVMHTTCKTAHPAPAFLLQRRGHDKIEYGFSKRLN
jgi:L-amino acid N-acyltransferase YncA